MEQLLRLRLQGCVRHAGQCWVGRGGKGCDGQLLCRSRGGGLKLQLRLEWRLLLLLLLHQRRHATGRRLSLLQLPQM